MLTHHCKSAFSFAHFGGSWTKAVHLIQFFLYLLYKSIQARRRLSKILSSIIKERKEERSVQKGLLGCLLNSRDENGQILTDDQIADNIIGVLFAAQDTTASMLTWILKYIHDDPKLLAAIRVTIPVQAQNFLPTHWTHMWYTYMLHQCEQEAIYKSNGGGNQPLTWAQTKNMAVTQKVSQSQKYKF